MKITLNKKVMQKSFAKQSVEAKKVNTKEFLLSFLKSKNEYRTENINFKTDDDIEIKNLSALSLHSFLLKAEELGLNIQFEKKTVITLK